MTYLLPDTELGAVNNLSASFSEGDFAQSAKDLYLKRDYNQGFLGFLAGALLTLLSINWYYGGLGILRPGGGEFGIDGINRPSRWGTLRVRGSNVVMRSCPGYNCGEITRLRYGQRVEDLGDADYVDDVEWIRVRAGNREGWVAGTYLQR